MADRWYFGRDGEKLGPFSAQQLKGFATIGRLRPQDTVWKEGVEKGVLASRVRHLFAASTVAPPTAPPVPAPGPVPPEPASVPAPVALDVPEDVALAPLEEAPADSSEEELSAEVEQPRKRVEAPSPPPRKLRVLGIKGGIMVSQNDGVLRYRKKCDVCGQPEPSVTNTPIRSGMTRVSYYCRKCRKSRQIEIQVV